MCGAAHVEKLHIRFYQLNSKSQIWESRLDNSQKVFLKWSKIKNFTFSRVISFVYIILGITAYATENLTTRTFD